MVEDITALAAPTMERTDPRFRFKWSLAQVHYTAPNKEDYILRYWFDDGARDQLEQIQKLQDRAPVIQQMMKDSRSEIEKAISAKRYPVEILEEIGRRIPSVKCDITRFSEDAWKLQILRPPYVRPDGTENRAQGYWLSPDRPDADVVSNGGPVVRNEVAGAPPARKSRPTPAPILLPQTVLPLGHRDPGFVEFLHTVPSPTHKRVTAGGRVVPAEPGLISPVAAARLPQPPWGFGFGFEQAHQRSIAATRQVIPGVIYDPSRTTSPASMWGLHQYGTAHSTAQALQIDNRIEWYPQYTVNQPLQTPLGNITNLPPLQRSVHAMQEGIQSIHHARAAEARMASYLAQPVNLTAENTAALREEQRRLERETNSLESALKEANERLDQLNRERTLHPFGVEKNLAQDLAPARPLEADIAVHGPVSQPNRGWGHPEIARGDIHQSRSGIVEQGDEEGPSERKTAIPAPHREDGQTLADQIAEQSWGYSESDAEDLLHDIPHELINLSSYLSRRRSTAPATVFATKRWTSAGNSYPPRESTELRPTSDIQNTEEIGVSATTGGRLNLDVVGEETRAVDSSELPDVTSKPDDTTVRTIVGETNNGGKSKMIEASKNHQSSGTDSTEIIAARKPTNHANVKGSGQPDHHLGNIHVTAARNSANGLTLRRTAALSTADEHGSAPRGSKRTADGEVIPPLIDRRRCEEDEQLERHIAKHAL